MFKLEESGDDPLLAGPGVTVEGASTRTMQHAGGACRRRLCSITIPSADSVAFPLQAILAPRRPLSAGGQHVDVEKTVDSLFPVSPSRTSHEKSSPSGSSPAPALLRLHTTETLASSRPTQES